jgi:thiamine-phosphate pyrophosphorylase
VSAPDVIAITDPRWSDDELALRAEAMLGAVPPGSLALQLRDKVRDGRTILSLAERLHAICSRHRAPFYVNDRLDVALALAADGAHLGEASVEVPDARALLGPDRFISVSAHCLQDVERARLEGANAVLASPIFATPGKPTPQGTRFLSEARNRAGNVRVYALGGVDVINAARCRDAGADGVGVVRALWDVQEPSSAALALVAAVRGYRE